jgi:hypothetical protein
MMANVSFTLVFFLSRCVFMPQLSVQVIKQFREFPFQKLHPITYIGFMLSFSCLLIL